MVKYWPIYATPSIHTYIHTSIHTHIQRAPLVQIISIRVRTMHEFTTVYARITKFTWYLVLINVALYAGLLVHQATLNRLRRLHVENQRETLPNPGRNTYRSSLSTIVPVSTQGVLSCIRTFVHVHTNKVYYSFVGRGGWSRTCDVSNYLARCACIPSMWPSCDVSN